MPDAEKPDPAASPTKAFGQQIALLRNRQGLSRAELVKLLDDELEEFGFSLGQKVSEGWLRNIEDGNKVKITRPVIELLASALNCTSSERFYLMMLADRNPLADSDGNVGVVEEFLLRAISDVNQHPRARFLLSKMVGDNKEKVAKLTSRELFDILEKILMMVRENDRPKD